MNKRLFGSLVAVFMTLGLAPISFAAQGSDNVSCALNKISNNDSSMVTSQQYSVNVKSDDEIHSLPVTEGSVSNVIESNEQVIHVYQNGLVSPGALTVRTGEILRLSVMNHNSSELFFQVPIWNLAVNVPANSTVEIPLSFNNPPGRTVYYRLTSQGAAGLNIPGEFLVSDYKPQAQISSREIDTSMLNSIINYSTANNYVEKPEPSYNMTTSDRQETQFIRGYW